ncbi:MAG: dTDP-glucose 4,6-dehydratase [Candidatus Pacebacteria bacterium CG_4_10_14_0_8_um_filter_43_12]|nr:MAG: dTDP-glucose 4,6-dehydratase [Candidatus Pacebacteria bacterium CG_4_10_14_0_8_um_filter_43_12]
MQVSDSRSNVLLVTGGAGFIGSNFILYWLENHPHDKIINFDALTYAGNLKNLASIQNNENYSFIQGTICDPNAVDLAMAEADIVVHFAAETHVDRSIKEPAKFLETNIMGTHVLLQAALKHHIKRFHHISTDEVFGSLELGSQEKFSELTNYWPSSPYSASKASADHLVRAYGETYGLDYSISNCSNNYGPYQFPEKLMPLTIANILENQPVPIYGDGNQIRDWLFVKDHCAAIEQILLNGAAGSTYLVGGLQKDVSNLELVKMILHLMGKTESQIKYVTDRPGHDKKYSVDWSKIHTDLGWSPSVTLEEGLQQTIDWYTTHRAWWQELKAKNQRYFQEQYGTNTKLGD